MILLFDIGNTRLKWGCGRNGRVVESGALLLSQASGSSLKQLFAGFSDVESVWVSNVSNKKYSDVIRKFVRDQFSLSTNIVAVTAECSGVANRYDDLQKLGVDRWVAAIGASALYPGENSIVVDVGTAITIDVLTASGHFEGGVIMPGGRLMHDSLVNNTVGIESTFETSTQIIGKTTIECVNSGVSYGLGGAVDRVVENMLNQLDKQTGESTCTRVVVTGGGRDTIHSVALANGEAHVNLVLTGLLRIANNSQQGAL